MGKYNNKSRYNKNMKLIFLFQILINGNKVYRDQKSLNSTAEECARIYSSIIDTYYNYYMTHPVPEFKILGSRDQKEYSRHKRHKRPSKDLKKNLETKTLKEATKMTHPKNYASHAAYKISVSLDVFYFIIINYSKH